MKEHVLLFGKTRSLVGLLTEPDPSHKQSDVPAMLILNAGLLHRVGPNCLYVKLARCLAQHGFPVLRFDFSGIGDSLVDNSAISFAERALYEAREAMTLLTDKMKIQNFVPIGICTGADVAFALAVHDNRVVGAVSINGSLQDSDIDQETSRQIGTRIQFRYYRKQLFNPKSWSRFVTGKSNLWAILASTVNVLRPREHTTKKPSASIENMKTMGDLHDRGVNLLAIFSEGSSAWDLANFAFGGDAKKLTKFKNIQLEYVQRCDHVFTPLWSQDRLLHVVHQWACERMASSSQLASPNGPGPG